MTLTNDTYRMHEATDDCEIPGVELTRLSDGASTWLENWTIDDACDLVLMFARGEEDEQDYF